MTHNIAETVAFKLVQGVSHDQFLAAIRTTESFVRNNPGFIDRRLSLGEDGRWTDTVIWTNMETAQTAAAEFPKQDFAPALMAVIDGDSVIIRHESIRWAVAPA